METRDLILDKARFEDWKDLYRNVWSRPETARYMLWTVTDSEEEARARMERTISWQSGHDVWTVYEKSSGLAIGWAGLAELSPGVWQETGIALGPDFVGRGFGRQILGLLMELAQEWGGTEFRCSAWSENTASKALITSCGFTLAAAGPCIDRRNCRPYVLETYTRKLSQRADNVRPYTPSFLQFKQKRGNLTYMPDIEKTQFNRAVLVGLNAFSLSREENADEESMEELAALLETAGGQCVGVVTQSKDSPDPRTFIGEGKTAEVRELVEASDADMVIFDNPLSPSQQRNLAEELKVSVLDRSALILDIFAQRARTKEGRLQVELAQYKYLLPRLLGMWKHLERQEGAIGTRGPGETQLESDRRILGRKIAKLESELKDVRRVRATQRERRIKNEVPVVAIVGYTNAGKSTLLNYLTGAEIPANNRLFDTLDTTTRTLEISDTCTVLLSDTVGFIRKLPHHLVEAFKATLEELEYADLLLHVIDSSSPQWQEQAEVVDQLIQELGANETPRIEVFNKCDLWTGDIRPHGEDRVSISAKTGEGVPDLLAAIGQVLDNGARKVTIHLPYDRGGLLDKLYLEAKVEKVDYGETIDVTATCPPKVIGQLGPLVEGWKPHREPWEEP
ncbi:GTPase HflX [Colidextribacter sp. OB.20]|uniref:GTPase HflX n=1 Tax=Colidextribacter sp. OB.20 TaxID=2304568 RepID=UPI0013683DC6|nr:GTPase HflX [Colidextribacter sp. OB.20]NBI11102.1 GTPase HflX [Colidextribacter sp. OB.20]